MANEEVIDYKKYLSLIKRDRKLAIITAMVVMTLVTVTSYILPRLYEANSTVFIEKSVIAELVKGLAVTPSIDDKIKVLTYAMNSRTLINKVVDELDMRKGNDASQEDLIKKIQDNTTIKIRDREGLFVISYKNSNPKIARDYVNALIRRYIDENTSNKREESYGATTFISDQLKNIKDKLVKTEEQVNEYKRGPGAAVYMDSGMVVREIKDYQAKIEDLRVRQAYLESQIASLAKVNSAVGNLPQLQKKLQELRVQFTDNYPDVILLKEEIRALEDQKKGTPPALASDSPDYDKLTAELRMLRQTEANYQRNIEKSNGLLQSIPAVKSTIEDMERERLTQKKLYDDMAARQGQSEVSKQMEVQDKSTVFRVVDPAVLPINPVSPNKKKLILIGIIAGIVGGIGLVVAKDALDSSVKSVDMARGLGLRLLAVIPRMEEAEVVARQARQYRKLYIAAAANMLLVGIIFVWEAYGGSLKEFIKQYIL